MNELAGGPPILRLGVSAVNATDDARLQRALSELAGQPSTAIINTQANEGQYNIDARAESDLDFICDRIRDDYSIAIDVRPPRAILLEAIRNPAEGEGKYIRQVGGSGNYGHCKLRIAPVEPGAGYEFANEIRDGSIPDKFLPAIEQGIQDAMGAGVLAGHPIRNVKTSLIGGSFHEADSNEMAFRFASSSAFKEAAVRASPVLMEPMMALELDLPEGIAAALEIEIYALRGRIERSDSVNGFRVTKVIAPLSELLSSSDSALTVAPMEFIGYEPVQDDYSGDEGEVDVMPNKPRRPRSGGGSEMVPMDPEEG